MCTERIKLKKTSTEQTEDLNSDSIYKHIAAQKVHRSGQKAEESKAELYQQVYYRRIMTVCGPETLNE